MKKSTCAMKNAVGKWGFTYTSVREKLGLKTIKMADGLVNKYKKGKRYLILTYFFFQFFIFHIVTRMARTLARMTRMAHTLARMTRMARWLAH